MPSESLSNDPPGLRLRSALEPHAAAFRAALAGTLDQVRAARASRSGVGSPGESPLALALGAFASGRIDAGWLGKIVAPPTAPVDGEAEILERIFAALTEVHSGLSVATAVRIPLGGSLRDAVADAYGRLGRAFGAARALALLRERRYVEAEHGAWLRALPFATWTSAERRLAPPLTVDVDGADLHGAALAEFLDGQARIACVVHGASTPAPLARLLSPRAFVLQTSDAWGLDRLATHDGPAAVALLPEGAAAFVHEPARGGATSSRLEIRRAPAEGRRKPVGRWSAWQQEEEARCLAAWVDRSSTPATAGAAPSPAAGDPVNRLAAWLVSQANWKEMDRDAGANPTRG